MPHYASEQIPGDLRDIVRAAELLQEPRNIHAQRIISAAKNWRNDDLIPCAGIPEVSEKQIRAAWEAWEQAEGAIPMHEPTPEVPDHLILPITPAMRSRAEKTAAKRLEAHNDTRTQDQDYGEGNFERDRTGRLGEIILTDIMKKHGIGATGDVAFSKRTPTGSDLIINATKFDAKTPLVRDGKQPEIVTINQRAHQDKAKRPDFYLFVRLNGEETEATLYMVKAGDVDDLHTWKEKVNLKNGSKYLLARFADLTPLRSLDEIAAVAPPPHPLPKLRLRAEAVPAPYIKPLAPPIGRQPAAY